MSQKIIGFALLLQPLKKVSVRQFLISFSSVFGAIWLFLEPASFFLPERLNFGSDGYLVLVGVSLLIALWQNRPKLCVSRKLTSPDTQVEIRVGDLFDQNAHLVIGLNDAFDTEIGEIIRDSSVQGQFLTRVYRRDQQQLDIDIETVLQADNRDRKFAQNKAYGKPWRHRIGTTVTLGSHEKRFFLTVYGYMNNDLTVKSSPDYISTALDELWQEMRRKCHGTEVAMPIIGSDLARTGLSRMQLAKLIISSFIVESKRRFITCKLTIMIYPKDLDNVDLYELQEFLKSACF